MFQKNLIFLLILFYQVFSSSYADSDLPKFCDKHSTASLVELARDRYNSLGIIVKPGRSTSFRCEGNNEVEADLEPLINNIVDVVDIVGEKRERTSTEFENKLINTSIERILKVNSSYDSLFEKKREGIGYKKRGGVERSIGSALKECAKKKKKKNSKLLEVLEKNINSKKSLSAAESKKREKAFISRHLLQALLIKDLLDAKKSTYIKGDSLIKNAETKKIKEEVRDLHNQQRCIAKEMEAIKKIKGEVYEKDKERQRSYFIGMRKLWADQAKKICEDRRIQDPKVLIRNQRLESLKVEVKGSKDLSRKELYSSMRGFPALFKRDDKTGFLLTSTSEVEGSPLLKSLVASKEAKSLIKKIRKLRKNGQIAITDVAKTLSSNEGGKKSFKNMFEKLLKKVETDKKILANFSDEIYRVRIDLDKSMTTICEEDGKDLHHIDSFAREVINTGSSKKEQAKLEEAYCLRLLSSPLVDEGFSLREAFGLGLIALGTAAQVVPIVGNGVGTGLIGVGAANNAHVNYVKYEKAKRKTQQFDALYYGGWADYDKVIESAISKGEAARWGLLEVGIEVAGAGLISGIKVGKRLSQYLPSTGKLTAEGKFENSLKKALSKKPEDLSDSELKELNRQLNKLKRKRAGGQSNLVSENTITRETLKIVRMSDEMRWRSLQLTFPKLNKNQILAVQKAHTNYPCVIGTCTHKQLGAKMALLKKAGISKKESKDILRRGYAGDAPVQFKLSKIDPMVDSSPNAIALNQFTDVYNKRLLFFDFNDQRRYVSYVGSDGVRVHGQVVGYSADFVKIVPLGRKVPLEVDPRAHIRQSFSSYKQHLLVNTNQRTLLSGEDPFVSVYNSRFTPTSEDPRKYISYATVDGGRLPAEIVGYEKDLIRILDHKTGRELLLQPNSGIRQSTTSYLHRPSIVRPQVLPRGSVPLDENGTRAVLKRGPPKLVEGLERLGLAPKKSYDLGGGQIFHVSKIVNVEGKAHVIGYIEIGGKVYPRTIYKSNSQGVFRITDHIDFSSTKRDFLKPDGIKWYSKGEGEKFMSLPSNIQKDLLEGSSNLSELYSMSKADFVSGVSKQPDLGIKYEIDNKTLAKLKKRAVIAKKDDLSTSQKLDYDSVLHVSSPESVVIKDRNFAPDFTKPIHRYKTTTSISGEVDVMVYKSPNGKVEFTLFKDKVGKIWFADIRNTSGSVNRYGVLDEVYDYGDLASPRWEYPNQIARDYLDIKGETSGEYLSNWKYVKEIPEIKEWYRVQGIEVPD